MEQTKLKQLAEQDPMQWPQELQDEVLIWLVRKHKEGATMNWYDHPPCVQTRILQETVFVKEREV